MNHEDLSELKNKSADSSELLLDSDLNSLEKKEKVYTNKKSPGLAFLLSFILPAGGQFYNEQVGKGVGFICMYGLSIGVISWIESSQNHDPNNLNGSSLPPIPLIKYAGLGLALVTWLWSMSDAVSSADKINMQIDKKNKTFYISPYLNQRDIGLAFTYKF